LRREEVAVLAAISTDYYTRMEQGRIQASVPILVILAQVLRLNADQREYLFGLARKNASYQPPSRAGSQHVRPQLLHLLGDLGLAAGFVIGRYTDVLAWNPLAAALVTDFGQIPPDQRNYVRLVFTDRAIRALYLDWEEMARLAVAHLRMDSRLYPDDPRLTALVTGLSARDPQFRQWWASRDVALRGGGTRLLRHPVAGDLTFERSTFICAEDPEQQLVVWTAAPGSPTREALRVFASGLAAASGTGFGTVG
jgi:hypothetical protein